LKAISESLEGFTASMLDEVQRLPRGVAVISTMGLPHPIVAEIRPRESKHGGVSKVV
jgi:DNA helicase HerA-like ATPase